LLPADGDSRLGENAIYHKTKNWFIMVLRQGQTGIKPTILMTTALFLLSAPAPDSKTISEVSAGFLLARDHGSLLASQGYFPAAVRSTGMAETEVPQDETAMESAR
jgi:hypothetical protein